ncbi:hypothetical protein ACIRQQ_39095 [Streptomyces fuscichromogenes]|uniref:hypothetical protein n=1 Tax=Streptomyces fuscichromogenes TaxID=1324013 RepID=UPI0037FC159E
MTTQETDRAEDFPPRCSSEQHPGGTHRRPRSDGGRALASAVFIAACTGFGLAVAAAAVLAAPPPERTAVFLAVQAAATFLAVILGLLRRTRRASDDPSGMTWPATGEYQSTAVNGGGAIPGPG